MNESTINLKDYNKIKLLGRGSFAEVYLVEHNETKEQYAAKIINEELDSEDLDEIPIFDEVSTHMKMDNPAVLKIFGYSKQDFSGEPYLTLILENMPNDSLIKVLTLIRKKRTLNEWTDTKVYINLLGIALGMKYIHSKDTIHRDLKPANILLDANYYPHISDFGLAKQLEHMNSDKFARTQAGTPYYMAPEVLKGFKYTYKVDVYAYAIMAYELLTTNKPYPNDFVIYKVIDGVRPETSLIDDPLKVELLERCWSNNPSERLPFSAIVKILEDKRFYSKFNVDVDEIKKYLELFENESLNENVPSKEAKSLDDILSTVDDESLVADLEESKRLDAEAQDESTIKTINSNASTILDLEIEKQINKLVEEVFEQPIFAPRILKDTRVYKQQPEELLITPETTDGAIQRKPYEDFIPTMILHLDRPLKDINYEQLQELLGKNAVIINAKSCPTSKQIPLVPIEDFYLDGVSCQSNLQVALLSISSFNPKTVETELNNYITELKNKLEGVQPSICQIVGETKICIPSDEDIKGVYSRPSIGYQHDSDDFYGVDMRQIRKKVLQRLESDKTMYNWKFYFEHEDMYKKMNEQIRADLERSPCDMVMVNQTFFANELIDEYKKSSEEKMPKESLIERFLYNGSIVRAKGQDGIIGEGFYATEEPFVAVMQMNENQELKVNKLTQIVCYMTVYNESKVNNLEDESFQGKPIEDGVNHAFVADTKNFMPIKQAEKDRDKDSIIAEEFAFADKKQIIPICLITLMKRDHFVLWKDDKFADVNIVKTDKESQFLINWSRQNEVNVYLKSNVDEALNVIVNKRNQPLKLITNGGAGLTGRELITKARDFTHTEFVCLVFATSINHIEWISKFTNVLFTPFEDYFKEFVELKMNKESVFKFQANLKNIIIKLTPNHYEWKTDENQLLEFYKKDESTKKDDGKNSCNIA